jgi:DNA polymerase bacteriophage-type
VARGPGGRPFIVHNCVQAIARDLMANGMLKAERAGYPIVMTVHDEAVADVPVGHGSLPEFEGLLCDLPDWAAGIPLVASGYTAERYRKE